MRRTRSSPFATARPAMPLSSPSPSKIEGGLLRVRAFCRRFRDPLLVGAGALLALAVLLAYDASKPPPQRLTQRDINNAVSGALASATPPPSFASRVFQAVHPSVVRVEGVFPDSPSTGEVATGAGVVIDEAGTILSSLHVISGTSAVRVTFADGSESDAQVILRQPENDLTVLRPSVIPDDLVAAVLAGSGGLRVGDEVFAVGNPFGISNSLSSGVVSGLGRQYRSLRNMIQFDAAVNPGNSGGPLLDRDGEVVGIVTGLLNPTDQDVFIGIGFAVPIETAAGALGSPAF